MLNDKQIGELKKLAAELPIAKATFTVLATRERPRAITDLRRLKQQIWHEQTVAVTTEQFLSIFRLLAKMKLGTLHMPKSDIDPPRFKWTANYIDVGCAVTGAQRKPPAASVSASSGSCPPSYPHVLTSFPLRGSHMPLHLPQDGLSKEELEQLITLLKMHAKRQD